jgi:hypothetical protein
MQAQDEALVAEVASANKACGTTFPVIFDWAGAPEDKLEAYSSQAIATRR